jgi:S1-C subfamily serine protease
MPDPLVASIQTLLEALGYDVGKSDGLYGPRTQTAILAFQRSIRDVPDGRPSEALRGKLQATLSSRGTSPVPQGPVVAQPETRPAGSGTGFFIGSDLVVTNHHVIDGCKEIRIRKRGAEISRARIVAANRGDDLAALKTAENSEHFLRLRVGVPIRAAESVVVFGYPLSLALSSLGNTTLGNVTALTGMRDDSRYIQISAPIQPGNSGGPVLDDAGRLMAVITGTLDPLRLARVTGDIPQNVNFAIRVSTVVNFLEANHLPFEVATSTSSLSNVDIAERADRASVQIECRK